MFKLFDRAEIAKNRHVTRDGYLAVVANVARAGVMDYLGTEVGKPEMATVKVYTPPEVLFDAATLAGFAHRPLTNDHPAEDVTSANYRKLAVGHSGSEIVRDGAYVQAPMLLMDSGVIQDVRNDKRELSAGRDVWLEFRDGVTPDGEPYNAVVTKLQVNHIAVVDKARGGSKLRIGDNVPAPTATQLGPVEKIEMEMVAKVVDGVTYQLPPQGAQLLDVLQGKLKDSETALAAANKLVGAKDAEIATLKDSAVKPGDVDRMVAERAELIATAAKLIDGEGSGFAGKTDEQIRSIVVAHKLGDAAIVGMNADRIAGAFAFAVSQHEKTDPVQRSVGDSLGRTPAPTGATKVEDAYAARDKAQAEAWNKP